MDELTRLAIRAQDGDQAALAAFVARSQAEVWRLCRHLGAGVGADADDLTQETYLRALRALPRFRADASARTWLLSIARRTVADAVRTAQRRRRLRLRLPLPLDDEPDHAVPVTSFALLAHLDDDRRAALVLTQVLGLSYAEAAEVCHVPVGTIRSRVARSREQLVAMMAEEAEGS